MNTTTELQKVKNYKIFYGWYVLAAGFAIVLTMGGIVWTFGVFFKPIESEFGWSRTVVSSGYTSFLLGHAISIGVAGRLADRYSPRPILLISAVVGGLGLALTGLVHNVPQMLFFLFLAGIGTGADWSVPIAVIQRWFYGRKGARLALAILVAGTGTGALLFAPLINGLIDGYGWRTSYIILGILLFIVMALSAIAIRQYREGKDNEKDAEQNLIEVPAVTGWELNRALASPAFYAITLMFCASDLTFSIVTVHLVPHATDVGISSVIAATALGLIGGFSVPARVYSGFLAEKISWQKVIIYSSFGMAASFIFLMVLSSAWMLYGFVILYGVTMGLRVPALIAILCEFFGVKSLGALIGIMTAISVVVGAAAPYLAGFVFDHSGSYLLAFVLALGVLGGSGVVAMKVKKPELK